MTPRCDTCRHWMPTGNQVGFCRRGPPMTMSDQWGRPVRTTWPTTLPGDWCGEYAERERP